MKDYLSVQLLQWTYHYFKSRFGPRHEFKDYDYASGQTGIHRLDGSEATPGQPDDSDTRVSLVADWATGTAESQKVADAVAKFNPHYTIHLGDVYYVGTKQEVQENFFSRVDWPEGSRGSFALNGNHEMYAKGKAYFERLLPTLGMRDTATGQFGGQEASFFCLANDYWRIIGLDTGYNSVRRIPLLEYVIPPSCRLPDPLIKWLREQVKPEADKRGLVVLSHHQYYSVFERGYEEPAKQLAAFIKRPVIWFWGHEHRLAVYGKYARKGGVEAYGRCMGHGGMPIEEFDKRPAKNFRQQKLVIYDARYNEVVGTQRIGFNGFINLTFSGNQLFVDYRDINDKSVLTERWAVDVESGALKGLGVQQHVDMEIPKDLQLPSLEVAQS